MKDPDYNNNFLHNLLSFIETILLMSIFAYFYSFTMHYTLLQMFIILETSVFHYQNALLEMKRQYTTTIKNKFKSFTFIMILLWTLFCTLIYVVGSYDWTQKSSMKYLLLDTTKTFFIYSSTFMVSVVIFLSFLSGANTKVDSCISSQNNSTVSTTDVSVINDSNSVLSKHSGSGESNDLSASVTNNINDPVTPTNTSNNDLLGQERNVLHEPKSRKTNANDKIKAGKVLAKKSKYDVLKIHMKAIAFTCSNKITKKKSNQSSSRIPNDATTNSNQHNDYDNLSSPKQPSSITRRKLFQVKNKQT